MARKSYWQTIAVRGAEDETAVKSWFAPLADDLTPYAAEVLCDLRTDREKKLRAFAASAEGRKFELTRTFGKRFTVAIKPLAAGARRGVGTESAGHG